VPQAEARPMIKLVYPKLQFSSAGLDRLSVVELQGPISLLGLSFRTQNVLRWKQVDTLGKLVEALRSDMGIGTARNFGRKSHEELVHSVLALSEAVAPEGSVDWQKYSKLARQEFCRMRSSQALRYVGLMPTPQLGARQGGWPRPFGVIPESVSNRLLHTLPFSNRAFQGLRSMGAVTIGDATRICPTDLLQVRKVGRNTIEEIFGTIMAEVTSQRSDFIAANDLPIGWQQFPILPKRSEGLPRQFYIDFFNELPSVIKKYEGNEEERILCARLLRSFGKEETLEVIGKQFGVTRERVRQQEAGLIRKLKAALFEAKYTYTKFKRNRDVAFGKVRFRVQPELQERCKDLPERIRRELPSVVKLSAWTGRLAEILCVTPDLITQYSTFWLTALRFKQESVKKVKGFKNEDLIFRSEIPTQEVAVVCKMLVKVNDAILCSPSGTTQQEILNKIKDRRSKKAARGHNISFFLKLSSVNVIKKKGIIQPIYDRQITLSWVDLEREIIGLLMENNGHIKKRTLLFKMQAKFPAIKNIQKAAIDLIIAKSKNMSSIGKTGYCKLRKLHG